MEFMNQPALTTNIDYPVSVVALGGLDEMGKNCYVIEVNHDAFVIEAGMKYPSRNIPGVDLIIPDFEYLKQIQNRIKGIIITHGHDDQYGALPFLLDVIHAPVYASKTTVAIIKSLLGPKFKSIQNATFNIVDCSSTLTIAGHVFDLFQTTHSVSESFGFALKTPFGDIVYTSDYMSDYSPLKGFTFDLPKVARLSENNGTFLLMAESEAADKPGIASPNHKITEWIKNDFEDPTGKTFISIFSQNFYNIQEVINLARKYRKKICIADPNQIAFFDAMGQVGDIEIPDNMRVALDQVNTVAPKDLIVMVSGSGEGLYNYCKEICYGNVRNLKVETNDTWINACPSVPGTESLATDASDTIYRTDCHVIALNRKQVASMHAQQEDLKMMLSLLRPRYYMPVKGEFRLLMANAQLAISRGIGLNHFNTFVYDNGMALAFDTKGNPVRKIINVKQGDVMVDGNSVGDVKEAAITERQKMADGGVVLMGISISMKQKKIVTTPDIQMRGFISIKDNEPILGQLSNLLVNACQSLFSAEKHVNIMDAEKKVSDKAAKMILKQTEKEPLVLVKILDVDGLEEIDPR
jgi:ribonuclease J